MNECQYIFDDSLALAIVTRIFWCAFATPLKYKN